MPLCRVFKTRKECESETETAKLLSNVRKRLQQVKRLEGQRDAGQGLDAQQAVKVAQRAALEEARGQLEAGADATCVPMCCWTRHCILTGTSVQGRR